MGSNVIPLFKELEGHHELGKLLVGAKGNFSYDVQKDEARGDELQQMIFGYDGAVNYSKIMGLVDHKSKTQFQEMSLGFDGNEELVETAPILLTNGNIIQERYRFVRGIDNQLLRIDGDTELIRVAS